jgi:ubiquinone/menaquinone biosynthesis C-methylase UbiE
MTLAEAYKRQLAWRDWSSIFAALPSLAGQTVLDLGCAVGDQSAELACRGARVIGVEINEELLHEARSRGLDNVEFRLGDLRELPDLGAVADGIWCSFAAAYFIDLPQVLTAWARQLRPGGWIALTEIDDFFGHEPLSDRSKSLFEAYVCDALDAKRYDFRMGRKLAQHLSASGFVVTKVMTVEDQELSFDGPASAGVVEGWRTRFERMTLLRASWGPEFEPVRDEFLRALADPSHRSQAKVCCCIAVKPDELPLAP